MELTNYIGEIVGGVVLALLAWGFKSWSQSIRSATTEILARLDYLTKEFHQHRIDVERRVTRVEVLVEQDIFEGRHRRHHREDESE